LPPLSTSRRTHENNRFFARQRRPSMRIAIRLNSTNLEVPLGGGQAILTHSVRHVLLRDASVCNLLVGVLVRCDRFHDQGIPKLYGFPGRRQARQDRNNPGYSETASKRRLEFFASRLISPENSHRRTDIGSRPARSLPSSWPASRAFDKSRDSGLAGIRLNRSRSRLGNILLHPTYTRCLRPEGV
jgi:hypothetical protein